MLSSSGSGGPDEHRAPSSTSFAQQPAVSDETQVTENSLLQNLISLTDEQLVLNGQSNAPPATYVPSSGQLPTDPTPQLPADLQDIPETQLMRLQPALLIPDVGWAHTSGHRDERERKEDSQLFSCGNKRLAQNDHIAGHACTIGDAESQTKIWQFGCSQCSAKFARQDLLDKHECAHNHFKRRREGELPNQVAERGSNTHSANSIHENKEVNYKCNICGVTLEKNNDIKEHLEIHSHAFPCLFCTKRFSSDALLEVHQKAHCSSTYCAETDKFVCTICNQQFSNRWILNRHTKIHTGDKPFSCKFCNARFSRNDNKTRHENSCFKVNDSLRIEDQLYPCEKCNSVCSDIDSLRRHAELHTYLFMCFTCQKRFPRNDLLQLHIVWAHPFIGNDGRDEDIGLFPCSECKIVCADAEARERHVQEHAYHWICTRCDKKFAVEKYLVAHERNCNSSDEGTDNEEGFLAENARESSLNIPNQFTCPVCESQFTRKEHLDQHLRAHQHLKTRNDSEVESPPRRVVCGRCDFECRDEQALGRHMATHADKHPTEEEKKRPNAPPFVGSCGGETGQFGEDAALICQWPRCGKTFAHRESLARHTNSHKSEKQFICRHCGMKFVRSVARDAHIRQWHQEFEIDEDQL